MKSSDSFEIPRNLKGLRLTYDTQLQILFFDMPIVPKIPVKIGLFPFTFLKRRRFHWGHPDQILASMHILLGLIIWQAFTPWHLTVISRLRLAKCWPRSLPRKKSKFATEVDLVTVHAILLTCSYLRWRNGKWKNSSNSPTVAVIFPITYVPKGSEFLSRSNFNINTKEWVSKNDVYGSLLGQTTVI